MSFARPRFAASHWRVHSSLRTVGFMIGVLALALPLTLSPSLMSGGTTGAAEEPWTPSQAPLPTAPLPDGGIASGLNLLSTSCSSAAFCVSVGWVSDGTQADGWLPKFPLVETYVDGVWTPSVPPLPPDAESPSYLGLLTSVSCGADGDCSAVGVYNALVSSDEANQSGLLEQLAGGAWTATTAPLPNGPNSGLVNLNSVSCSDAVTCVAVGTYSSNTSNSIVGFIYALQDGVWNPQTVPVPTGSNAEYLNGVACPDDGDCTAVGEYQDTSYNWYGLILTLDDGTWSYLVAPDPPGLTTSGGQLINTVDCPEPTTCVAGGTFRDANEFGQAMLLQEQAGAWTSVEAPVPTGAPADPNANIVGVYCPAGGTCVATGTYQPGGSGSANAGMILSLSGGTWTAQTAPLPQSEQSGAVVAEGQQRASAMASVAVASASSLSGVGCGTDGFCASGGQVGNGGGLIESGSFSNLPTVSGVSPSEGPVAGGTSVTIQGANFGSDSSVSFGGTAVPTTVVSATELEATAPAATVAGPVNVTVTTGGVKSRASSENAFYFDGAQNRVAGYSRSGSTPASQSAAVTFYVPSPQCSTLPKNSGYQVVDEGARLHTTSGDTLGAVVVRCVGIKAAYSVAISLNGTPVQTTLTAGAAKKVSIALSESTTASSVAVTIGTAKQTVSGPGGTVVGEDVGTMASDCNPATCAAVPHTSATSFTGVSIDGATLTNSGASLVQLQDSAGATEVAATKGSTTSFTSTWKMSCSTTADC